MKKRGFGTGKWNGPGGKFKRNDGTIENTAVRETKEEIGINPKNPEKLGVLSFYFPHNQDWNQDVHVFMVKEWEGKIRESKEMKPEWFNFKNIPFKKMWSDDRYWLKEILSGKKIKKGRFVFSEDDEIQDYDIEFS